MPATRERIADLFPVPLPDPVLVLADYDVTIRAAIRFADDWTPSLEPLARAGLTPRMPVEWGCVHALRPVYERCGIRWPGRRWRYRLRGYLPHAIVAGLLAAVPIAFMVVLLVATAPD